MLRRLHNQKGQGLIEYLILVSLMAIATIAITRTMGQSVQAKFARITQQIQGKKGNIEIKASDIKEGDFKRRDMSDFFHGASSKE